MGAYLSQPITKKESSDHEGSNVSCGASSMQGWRIYQEDAHNVIIDFDEKKSLFAVYDGHGGSEVAIYTSKHLPRFIKNTEEYKKGNYKQALINAFMEFDENLLKDEVMAVLKDLKKENEGDDSYPATDEDALDDDDDGDNVNNLYEEATMPLSEVISRYRNPGIQRLKESGEKPMSPRLKSKDKKSNEEGGEGCSSSSSSARSSGVTGSLSVPAAGSSSSCAASSSSSSSPKSSKVSKSDVPSSSSTSSSSTKEEEGASSSSKPESSSAAASSSIQPPTPTASTDEASDSTLSSSSSVKHEKESNGPAASSVSSSKPEENGSEEKKEKKKENRETNGGAKQEVAATEEEDVISSSDVKPLKAKDKPIIVVTNGDSEPDSSAHAPLSNGNKVQRTSPRKTLGTKNLLDSTMGDDSSESDEDFQIDEDLQGSSSDSDEGDEHIIAAARNLPEIDSDEDDDDEEEEEEDSDEDDSDYEEGEGGALSPEDLQKRMKEALDHKDVPGMDSGCTAVVVLFVDNQIYIANAGDSRAVLCRGPMAVDLSEDHKPEDEVERARIVKAGGEVTPDGRVNGGLNLSRALGDHSYKQTVALPLSEQMITALPDVTVQTLQPDDKFIVIACDGIWNSLSSQEVVDFISERIDKPDKKLSTICEELFDKCLAPDSLGDGTGCDNMTCVLVRLNGNRGGPVESHAHSSSNAQTAATKRTREEAEEEEEAAEAKPSAKKTKTDANEAAEAVAKITEEKSKTVDEPMSVESSTAAEATGSANKSTSESTEEVVDSST